MVSGKVKSSTVKYVPLGQLHVDVAYQRIVKLHRVKRMVASYDPNLVGFLLVGQRRNDSLWVIDGQHRLVMLREAGLSKARCSIIPSKGPAFEAELFSKINSCSQSVNPEDRFRALTQTPHLGTQEIVAVLDHLGYKLKLRRSAPSPMTVYRITPIIAMYHHGILERCLSLVADIWPEDHLAFASKHLSAMDVFINVAGDHITDAQIIRKLIQYPISKIQQFTNRYDLSGGSRSRYQAKAMANICDKRVRDKSKKISPLFD